MVWDGSLFGYTPPAPVQGGPVMPPPAPAPAPSPAPGGQQMTPQQLAQWVQQLLGGNAGGAQQAGGGYGGNAGGAQGNQGGYGNAGGAQHTVQMPDGSRRTMSASAISGVPGAIDLGPVGAGMLSALAAAAPGWAGVGLGAAQAGLRGWNAYSADQLRGQQGLPGLDFGQYLGGVLGLNKYGDLGGDQTVANPNQFTSFINDRIAQMYAPNGTTLFGQPNLYNPNSMAETSYGQDYSSGPGGILGWVARQLGLTGDPSHAWSAQNTSAFLGGPGSMGSTAIGAAGERGLGNAGGASNNSGSQGGGGNFGGVPSGFKM